MVSSSSLPPHLPVFAGQGTAAVNAPQTRQQALFDASSPSGSILLSACYEAFHAELSSLSPTNALNVQIDLSDFPRKESLLSLPKERYLHNAVVSGPTLFLIQSLRYLAFVEATGVTTGSLTPFSDILKRNLEEGLGVLGFSSGILPACVVGTSLSTITYISRAVEVYRLALWIGIHMQLYRKSALEVASFNHETNLPWSLVFVGTSKESVEEAILGFSKDQGVGAPPLYITATMDDTCLTVSGRPDTLSAFAATVSTRPELSVHQTSLDTLYHTPIHVNGARERVLADAASRNIQFPQFADIKVPIRSTLTGDIITKNETTGSLLELVVDMLLTQPVNWNILLKKVVDSSPENTAIRVLNMGPGAGLTRSIERAFPRGIISVVDSTVTHNGAGYHAKAKQEPIAITGMAVNMPGAPNASKLWELLEQGINTVTEIPEHRFTVSDYHESKNTKRTMRAHSGNFIDGVDEFDNKFFKISPREAKSMDPQQRILLHTAYEALEDSGYVPNSTPTSRPEAFGCYIGVATHDYVQNLKDNIDVYYSTGTLKAFLSGRISYAMQLSGPSIVVDTACSSSNVAIYQGARALMNRDCDSALVGGVNVISSPDMFLGLDRGHFLSPTGQCKAFDASADGYSRSEGCGIFVLKRLSDAIAENDRILGVIRGVEINQSGQSHSITHPHSPTQAILFKQVLENTNMDPNRVNVVEAHGTGTQAGDPSELESIRAVFAQNRTPDNPLHITSVKGNIGHLEAASGAAGLAKLLLMLRHKAIPRQISLKELNPRIAPLESDNTVIDVAHAPWTASHKGMPRVALLNNFGAAGSNTALLLEEYPGSESSPEMPGMSYVFGLSAKDDTALEALRSKYLQFLQSSKEVSLQDIAYTSTARRQIYNHRLAVSVNSIDDLIQKLSRALAIQTTAKNSRAVFVFSGQGGQYIGMGRILYQTAPLFKQCIDECHDYLIGAGFVGIHSVINGDPDSESSRLSSLEEFEAYQAAVFSLEYALAKLWISWGLFPAAVVGHSLGEYAALVIANVLSLKDALMLVASRVRFMVQKCAMDTTGMIAVNLEPTAVGDILRTCNQFSGVSISCYNSPIDCVVSGPLSQLRAFKGHLDAEVHCKNVALNVPFGYHSQAMAPLLGDLNVLAGKIPLQAPTIPIVSNVLGQLVLPGDDSIFNSLYFSRHCAEPVQFDKGIRSLLANPLFESIDTWIEIGPHPTTLPMLKSNPSLPRGSMLLGSLRKRQDPWAVLTTSLSQLYTSGIELQWREVFAHLSKPTCISLPSYPFSKTKFWIAYKENQPTNESESTQTHSPEPLITGYSMLHQWVQHPSDDNGVTAIFETPIKNLAGSIRGHSVGGMPLCPASVYIEQALAGVHLACGHMGVGFDNCYVALRKMEFVKPLVYDESVGRIVTTTITVQDSYGTFKVGSRTSSSSEESIHAHGEYRLQPTLQTVSKFARILPMISRHMTAVLRPNNGQMPEMFSTRTAYEVIFPRVVDYAKEYHTMRSIAVEASGMEGCAEVALPSDYDRGKFIAHPVFTDTLLHVAGFVANMQGGPNDAYICNEVGSVKIVPQLVDNDASYTVYCNNAWIPADEIMVADAYAVRTAEPKQIVAVIKGMQFRRVRLDRLKKGLAHAAGKKSSHPPAQVKFSIPAGATPPVHHHSEPERPSSSEQTIASTVIDIVSETCDINSTSLDANTELGSIGVDSLMTIEIVGKLKQTFPNANLNTRALSFCQSIRDIIREISAKTGAGNVIESESSTTVSSGASSPRTLATDDMLLEPTPLFVGGEFDVKQILASVLDISVQDIDEDVDFESLGLDSLTSIEARNALKNEFGLDLPHDFFSTFHTARTVQSYVNSHLQASKGVIEHIPTETKGVPTNIRNRFKNLQFDSIPISIQQSNSGRLPLFLIHDGSGLVNYYDRLSPLDRAVWGIHNPYFASGQPWNGVVEMANSYADYIIHQSTGPVLLGGWSFGGVIAFEAAIQLRKRGVHVQGILLIDSPCPVNHVPLSDSLIDSVINFDAHSSGSELRRLVKAQFSMNSRILGQYHPQSPGSQFPPLVLLRSVEDFNPSGVSDIPDWLADRSNVKLATAGWEALIGTSIRVIDIPGNHFQPFHPTNIDDVSMCIAEACEYLERK